MTGTRRLVRESQSGTGDVRGYTKDDQTGTRRLVRDLDPAVEKKKPQFEIDCRVEGVAAVRPINVDLLLCASARTAFVTEASEEDCSSHATLYRCADAILQDEE